MKMMNGVQAAPLTSRFDTELLSSAWGRLVIITLLQHSIDTALGAPELTRGKVALSGQVWVHFFLCKNWPRATCSS